ncbi:MAG: glycine cleavage system protein R [Thiohalospira sp.]|uniref:glycine cleavage system protein R n=1 Tax=Thiohalospira sp. TaxID=3080549 RepID=UPI00397EAC89
MENYLVISAVGEDRPGIVDDLARAIMDTGCNINDSRMTVLGGEFAVLLLVSGPWNSIAKLEDAAPGIAEKLELLVNTKRTNLREKEGQMVSYTVEVISIDQPGIVYDLATFFSRRGINIYDLTTERYAAAHTGTPMFVARMTINVPSDIRIAGLREEFFDMCDSLNLDAVIEPVKI